ncbi:MAG: hypothetical protein K6G11_00300 [Lachnospiraceae bacterium]|nr:hypothetical protein [Lachnospiraceae bacterium]
MNPNVNDNQNSKISNTSILMILGVLLISISGIIFVSSTWKYFSVPIKSLILFGSSAFFFLFAFIPPIRKTLPLASNIFYYLGTLFFGLTGVMISGGFISKGNYYDNAKKFGIDKADEIRDMVTIHNCRVLFLLCLGIIIPIAIKYYFNRFAGDILVTFLLVNVVAVTFPSTIGINKLNFAPGIVFLMFGAIFFGVCILKNHAFENLPSINDPDYEKAKVTYTVLKVLYVIEAACNVGLAFFVSFMLEYDIEFFALNILIFIFEAIVFATTYMSYKHAYNNDFKSATFQRIVNSFTALTLIFAAALMTGYALFYEKYSEDRFFYEGRSTLVRFLFLTFLLIVEIVFEFKANTGEIDTAFVRNSGYVNGDNVKVVHLKHAFKKFNRMEFFIATIVLSLILQMVEIFDYSFDRGFFGDSEYDPTYLPFSFMIAAYFAGLAIIRKQYKYFFTSGGFVVSGFLMLIAAFSEDFLPSAGYFAFSTIFIVVASMVKSRTPRSVLLTIWLALAVFSASSLPFLTEHIMITGEKCSLGPVSYSIIYLFALLAIRYIWYYSKKTASNIQFVGMAILLGFLLLYNFDDGDILSLLTMSIITIVTLVIGVQKQSRRYVLLSSIVLAITAIYLTRDFWSNIAWWIYLFIGGLGLVGYAVFRELKKRD